jgi:hypothetical protein
MRKALGLLLSLVFVSGCCNAVWVRERVPGTDGEFRQIGGIPFYVKKEVFVQETTYEQTWLKATLTVETKLTSKEGQEIEGIIPTKRSRDKYLAKTSAPELNRIKLEVLQGGTVPNDKMKMLKTDFMKMPDLVVSEIVPECVGNELKSSWVVNGDNTYYLNAPLPWFGTASLTQEINSDGTLSKTESKADTKLAEAVSSLLPIKEYLAGKFVDPLSDDTTESIEEKVADGTALKAFLLSKDIAAVKQQFVFVHTVSISTVEEGYRYRFTKLYRDKKPPEILRPIVFDIQNGLFTRETITQKTDGQIQPEDGKKVGLSGTISFPADWGGSK